MTKYQMRGVPGTYSSKLDGDIYYHLQSAVMYTSDPWLMVYA